MNRELEQIVNAKAQDYENFAFKTFKGYSISESFIAGAMYMHRLKVEKLEEELKQLRNTIHHESK